MSRTTARRSYSPQEVRKWIREHGFALEFRTAKRLDESGFFVWPGTFVTTDPDSPPREIDVLAARSWNTSAGRVSLDLFVECKYTGHAPWVVFCSRHAAIPGAAGVQSLLANPGGAGLLWLLQANSALHATDLFGAPDLPGYSGRQLGNEAGRDKIDKNDRFYSCMQSVVSIAAASLGVAGSVYNPVQSMQEIRIGLPLIVVDGQLFSARILEPTGRLSVKSVPWLRMHWRGNREGGIQASVDIVRFQHLRKYLSQVTANAESVMSLFSDAQDRAVDALNRRSSEPLRELLAGKRVAPLIHVPLVLHSLFASASYSPLSAILNPTSTS